MIETTRLLLRPMRADDATDLLRVFADPAVMASFGDILFDRDDMARWIDRNLEHQDRHGYGLFSIIHKADNLLIGDCGLERLDDADPPETELGYDLRSDYWNRGLATEAAAAVRDHAFRVLDLPRLVSLIRQGNAASRRVAEKIGMRHTEDVTRDGRDYWLYALDRDQAPRPTPRSPAHRVRPSRADRPGPATPQGANARCPTRSTPRPPRPARPASPR